MEVVVLTCHPRKGSLTHAVAARCVAAIQGAGHRALSHDLYQEGFDPILTAQEMDRGFSFDESVQGYGAELSRAGGLIVAHPDWWGQPPALLKGWIDRVLRPGVAYDVEGGDGAPTRLTPLLSGKRALVFCTTDAAEAPPSLEAAWLLGVFAFCGITEASVRTFPDTRASTFARRERWLEEVEQTVRASFPARCLTRPPAPAKMQP